MRYINTVYRKRWLLKTRYQKKLLKFQRVQPYYPKVRWAIQGLGKYWLGSEFLNLYVERTMWVQWSEERRSQHYEVLLCCKTKICWSKQFYTTTSQKKKATGNSKSVEQVCIQIKRLICLIDFRIKILEFYHWSSKYLLSFISLWI